MPKKICLVSTAPALLYLFNHALVPILQKNDWEITGLTSANQPGFGTENHFEKLQNLGVKMVEIPITRDPSLFQDIWCLIRLWWFFIWHRFDVIHASNPKAMLLATVAAFLAFHPRRIITVRGRVYENSQGWKRKIFVALDKINCFLANKTVVVSHSLRDAMLKDRIGTQKSLTVIANGSGQGCDTTRFDPERVSSDQVRQLREKCQLLQSNKVILFAGRLRKDKGIIELVQAFEKISVEHPDWHLLLFGHEEKVSDIGDLARNAIKTDSNIHHFDWTAHVETAYQVADIFVLPTWREGFPNTVLEASAMMLPVITTTAVGAVDSVVNNETGYLVPVNHSEQLTEKLRTLIENPDLRKTMGQKGRKRIQTDFDSELIWNGLLKIYNEVSGGKLSK